MTSVLETFDALSALPGLIHGFVLRDRSIPVDDVDKDGALARLRPFHAEAQRFLGIGDCPLVTAEQVHAAEIAVVDEDLLRHPERWPLKGIDGLITALPDVALGIHVADCGAVYLIDPVKRAIGLVHSGRKGTELGIAARAIRRMEAEFGSRPADLIVQLAACVRPPAYDVDFAGQILEQCRAAGVPAESVQDCGVCTSSDLGRYYSYRLEKGKTGRHLALAAWKTV